MRSFMTALMTEVRPMILSVSRPTRGALLRGVTRLQSHVVARIGDRPSKHSEHLLNHLGAGVSLSAMSALAGVILIASIKEAFRARRYG